MRYHQAVLLCIIFAFSLTAFSQEYEWSNQEKYRNSTATNRVLGRNNKGYYIIRSRSPEIKSKAIIERYRETLGQDFSKHLPGMKSCRFVELCVNEDHLVLWKSKFNQRTEKLEVIFQKLNTEAEIISEEVIVATATLRNFADNGDFYLYRNRENTHYSLVYSEAAPKKQTFINVQVFDNSLNRISSSRQLVPFEYEDFSLEQVEIDTFGNCFLLLSGVNHAFEKSTPQRIGTHLYSLGNNGDWKDFYLNFEDTYLHHPNMIVDHVNRKLIVTGLYSLESLSRSMGILDFGISLNDFKVLYHNFIPYTLSFVSEILGENAAREKVEPLDFVIRKLVAKTDGGYIIIGEEFNISQQSYTYLTNGMTQISSRSVFNYGKIFIISVTPRGELEWTKVINKVQSTINDYGHYSSFTTLVRKDKIYIFFNDKMKGMGDVLLFILDNQGNLEKETLMGNHTAYVSIIPEESRQIDANTILIPTSKDRKFAFLKITF